MSKILNSFDLWIRVQIVSSLSWPISIMVVSLFATYFETFKLTVLLLLLIGLVAGCTIALGGGLIVKPEVSNFTAWVLVNLVGNPISIIAAYAVFMFKNSYIGFVVGGLCSGLVSGAFHSLTIKRHHSKAAPLISGIFSWMLVFFIGSQLGVERIELSILIISNDFFTALLLGWAITGSLIFLILISLSPLPRYRYTEGGVLK